MLKIHEYFYRLQGRDLFVHKNHSHNEIELIQMVSGNGLVLKNDKTYVLQSQHIYVIDARNAHIVYPQPEDCADYIRNKIVIDADSFTAFYKELGMEDVLNRLFDAGPISTADAPEIDRLYQTVSRLCTSGKKEELAFAHGYVTELLHWVYVHLENGVQEGGKDTFQKMLDVINEKDGVTSLTEISEILHMDKYYLCRLFKQKTGEKLSVYLSEKVFDKSRKLLDSTAYSIEEVALSCGFSSQASFSRFFKNRCGESPSLFRKNKEQKICMYFNTKNR